MEFCACTSDPLNTGTPSKQRAVKSGVKLIAVRMKADDGSNNEILATDTIDQAYLDALINNEDESKRWYPIGVFKNQDDVRADAQTESFNDGSSAKAQQGVRTYIGWLLNYAAAYLHQLESWGCVSFGVFVVDQCGAITGSLNSDETALRPIRVNEKSWDPTYIKATPTTVAKVQLGFEFSQLEKDKSLRVISESEITADMLEVEGLLPLTAFSSGISTTGFVIDLRVIFDTFLNTSKEVVPGWVQADFALFNKTTNSSVVITSVTEAPQGTYTFVIPAQSSGDVLQLTNVKTSAQKPGYGLKQDITIP